MAGSTIPERVKEFLFRHIDSVEQLHVLLFLASRKEQWWSIDAIAAELRSNSSSIENRLKSLENAKIIQFNSESNTACFCPDLELGEIVRELEVTYKVRPHRILELVFSPVKRARILADAFSIGSSKRDEGEEDG